MRKALEVKYEVRWAQGIIDGSDQTVAHKWGNEEANIRNPWYSLRSMRLDTRTQLMKIFGSLVWKKRKISNIMHDIILNLRN